MGKGDDGRCIFPLTSLQIGDLQSYLSDLSLFLANDSKKMYILVDNRPWLRDLGSRRAHFWQLMVTKSRLSPFANTKARRKRNQGKDVCSGPSTSKPRNYLRWFSLIDAVMLSRKRVLLPVKKLRNSLQLSSELHRTLYGFIVFEVEWVSVRGISYLNELQTDTSLAIEAKFMKRWEFDSIAQAASCISSWFSGTRSEQLLLREHLDYAAGELFYDASEDLSETIPIDDEDNICNGLVTVADSSVQCPGSSFGVYCENQDQTMGIPHTPPPSGPYKRRKVMKSFTTGAGVQGYSKEMPGIDNDEKYTETSSCVSDIAVDATQYNDVLILFRFNDHDLPFKLREVIVSDLRLLTLLEAGLPSWVIFLQSYPVFCNLYRPWMCPLARVLYVLMSFVTVIIGFYDLYKNVPVLKATASRICGPLLDWIETWEMVSRIKYLGTMLFLHNFQKAVKWFLAFTHTTRSFFSVLIQPLAQPLAEFFEFLLPSLNMLYQFLEGICSIVWIGIETSYTLVGDLLELLLWPFWSILTLVWIIATSILYPIFWILWEIIYAPIRLVLAISSFVAFICTCVYDILGDTWQFVSSIFQVASSSEATISTYEVSIWRSLWNDLFSQIFRAVRSILNGFVAFFMACNRHRLSIRYGFRRWQAREVVYDHLICTQFPQGYTIWTWHGESARRTTTNTSNVPHDVVGSQGNFPDQDCMQDMIHDAFGVNKPVTMETYDSAEEVESRIHGDDSYFADLLRDCNEDLYPRCAKYSRLSFLIKLYHIKCYCRITDKAMCMILELLSDAFEHANIPSSFYEEKK